MLGASLGDLHLLADMKARCCSMDATGTLLVFALSIKSWRFAASKYEYSTATLQAVHEAGYMLYDEASTLPSSSVDRVACPSIATSRPKTLCHRGAELLS